MSELIQNLAVGLIVLGAVGFLVWRRVKRRARPTAMCGDCPGCAPVPKPESAKGAGLVKIEGMGVARRS